MDSLLLRSATKRRMIYEVYRSRLPRSLVRLVRSTNVEAHMVESRLCLSTRRSLGLAAIVAVLIWRFGEMKNTILLMTQSPVAILAQGKWIGGNLSSRLIT